MPTPPPPVVRFGTFEVDLRAGELRKGGVKVRLQDKPFRVLTTLLERKGELVSREELCSGLWPADTFVDFDNSLNNAVNRLRAALGDTADNPRFVETVGRRGYRFIAPIEVVGAVNVRTPVESPAPPPLATAPEPNRPSRRPKRALVGAALAGMAIVAAAVIAAVQRSSSPPSPGGTALRSIAVLPLADYSGDSTEDYFADGMTEALIAELARLRSLRVISRTSVMQYRGTTKPLTQIAKELGVDAIVEGSVLRSGERVRVTAQLVEGATDSHLWADTYHRDVRDVLALQSDVAQAIARAVRVEMSGVEKRTASLRTVDPEAFDLYLRGRWACTMRRRQEEVNKGIELLQRSIARDANYAEAHAALALCYSALGTILLAQPPEVTRPQAAAAAAKAIELDDTLAEAHELLATIDLREWRFERAAEGLRRAMELAPNHAAGHSEYAIYLAIRGRADEAVAEARAAEGLDPLSLVRRTSTGLVLQLVRRHDDSLRQFQSVLDEDPTFVFARWLMGISYTMKGMHEKAIECFVEAEKQSASASIVAWRAYALAMAGRRADARAVLDPLLARDYVPPAMIGIAFMALGDRDRAFEWLERGYAERSNVMLFLENYAFFDPLRADPRFANLVRRIGLPKRSSS